MISPQVGLFSQICDIFNWRSIVQVIKLTASGRVGFVNDLSIANVDCDMADSTIDIVDAGVENEIPDLQFIFIDGFAAGCLFRGGSGNGYTAFAVNGLGKAGTVCTGSKACPTVDVGKNIDIAVCFGSDGNTQAR